MAGRRVGQSRFSWLTLLVSLLVIASVIGAGIIGYRAFTHQLSPIVGAVSFIVIVGLFIWFITILRKPSMRHRKPSFMLVFWPLVGITLVCAFAGVEPLSAYKDNLFNSISNHLQDISSSIKSNNATSVPHTTPTALPLSSIPGIYISEDYPQSYLELNDDNTFAKRHICGDCIIYSAGEWQVKGDILTFLTKSKKETCPLNEPKKNPNQHITEIGLEDWTIESNRIKDPNGLYWQQK